MLYKGAVQKKTSNLLECLLRMYYFYTFKPRLGHSFDVDMFTFQGFWAREEMQSQKLPKRHMW